MNIGIVCEGRTDFLLLEQVALAVFGPSEIRPLQPLRDRMASHRWSEAGWTQVERWCRERGPDGLADELEIGGLNVIIVQVDGDLCGRNGLPATRVALCAHIRAAWLGDGDLPSGVVICIPAMATDVWLVAALQDQPDGPSLEAHPSPSDLLAGCGVSKNQYDYRERASALGSKVTKLRSCLSELDRFVGKLQRIAHEG
jgi:hypothetical protein